MPKRATTSVGRGCRAGMDTCCLNYGLNYGDVSQGHGANGFISDGGFCKYHVNNFNSLVRLPDDMSDKEATLVVTAGTAVYDAVGVRITSGASPEKIVAAPAERRARTDEAAGSRGRFYASTVGLVYREDCQCNVVKS